MRYASVMEKEWTIVGLGNKGEEYASTRHNVGRMVAEQCKGSAVETYAMIVTPDTYMNLSGGPVAKAIQGKSVEQLIVIHDDIDVPFGTIKISTNKGSGGQKGVEDVIKALGSNAFVRVRVGIAPVFLGVMRKPHGGDAVARFVLKPFGILERTKLTDLTKQGAAIVHTIVTEGLTTAMNRYN